MTETPKLRLRPMLSTDLERVFFIEINTHVTPWTRTILSDCVAVGYDCHVVVDEHDEIQGYTIFSIEANECHLFNICVYTEAQRKGYGKVLLDFIIEKAKLNHCTGVYLEVRASNDAALAMYRRNRFKATGRRRRYYRTPDGHEDAIMLALKLPVAKKES